jgi:hypothetical protein
MYTTFFMGVVSVGVCVWHVATTDLMAQIVRESDHMMKEGQGAPKSCCGRYHNMTTLAISLYDCQLHIASITDATPDF